MFLEVNAEKNLGSFRLNVEFSMGRGYCVILGPTGAGKSLLLELIAGIVKPDRGRVVMDGEDITEIPPEKRGIGFVPQDYALFPHMNVRKNIAYGLRHEKGHKKDKRVKEIAEKLGISHLLDREPATLSGGERQRVALARALVIKPKLILLDEPLSAVDLGTKEKLINELKYIHSEFEIPIVHVTHDVIEAAMLAEEMAVVMDGRIIKAGGVEDILHGRATEFRDGSLFKTFLEIMKQWS